ncbi:ABC transporter ATP-binding protein [Paenibacillus sp. KQZ6P-2]|uniref:ABC transporter ATP-binding protein n=1 Tax=Paenibacillus mangrovi TaxID=2931978 RepID=A0A9X1WP37_9BACL|nr:ABC transporter ATP-binding protein [Paenibacillus mangrovi]
MDEPIVRVEGLSKQIKQQSIVSDISFSLSKGSILALCGGNGAGKSTVLRMLAGIMQPTTGETIVNNIRWKHNRRLYCQQIGYMPDDYAFNHGLTAEETMSFWASLRKVHKKRVGEVLAMVGLENVRKKRVTTFSKGMRQRVMMAQAMLAKPLLLIMDEPTNGLDPFWTREFIKLLKQLKQDGSTIVFSTHQLEAAENAADTVIFLNHGRNVGEGSVDSFLDRYENLYAAFNDCLGLE